MERRGPHDLPVRLPAERPVGPYAERHGGEPESQGHDRRPAQAYDGRRRARVEQWAALQDAWGGCAYCGATDRALQRDCVLPISRGGRYTLDNIAPACGPCNASKCNDEVTGWLRRKKYDERAFLVRHHEIRAALAMRFPA